MGLLDKFKKKEQSQIPSQKVKDIKDIKKVVSKKKEDVAGEKSVSTAVKSEKKLQGNAHQVLLYPIISEKAAIGESQNTYTFAVNKKATKIDVKNAVKQVYGFMPKKVRIINFDGKNVRSGRFQGHRNDWKKALVSLSAGQAINIHEGV